jgi:hypothetical protein
MPLLLPLSSSLRALTTMIKREYLNSRTKKKKKKKKKKKEGKRKKD